MRRLILILLLAVTASAGQRFSYVYSRGNNAIISGGSVDDILRVHKRYSGPYLWVRSEGREYVMRDAGVLAEVNRAAAAMEAMEPEHRELKRKMKPLERKQDQLEDELDELYDNEDDEKIDRDRLRDLESQLRNVERELRVYEREEERFDRRHDQIEEAFDAELKRIVERAIRNGIAERAN
ncbi:MAG TPA: hypothetical protein VKB93_18640 [Thermoanaerobaculia bacterium]|nr:hypothetical protein [Thermoanaerobaculia bacterium]